MLFKLEKPDLSKTDLSEIVSKAIKHKDSISKFIKKISGKEYLYWDKVRYKEPSPNGFTKEALWMVVKMRRTFNQIKSVIKDKNGSFFVWSKLDYFEEFFHELDMNTGGELFLEKGRLNKTNKQKLIARGLMEEAIASSQLEGAATSRRVAKKMLQERRKPTNHSEQMILNNYLSMQAIEGKYKNKKMSLDLILELHSLITEGTVDSENEPPRLRKKGEPVYITNNAGGPIYYEAPDEVFVKKEIIRLIDFANDELDEGMFVHPVIKAIMLHFWIGYLHPFTDGNGRLARLLFYWYLIRNGYWAFAYLPISKVIKKSPKQYIMAYVYSEQDDNDLSYFLDYNISKLKIAIRDFKDYLAKQMSCNVKMKQKSEIQYGLNIRQIQLLQYFYGNSEERTTLKVHMSINQVAKMTAIKDLKDLVIKDFLVANKQGRNVYYYGTEKIKELFEE
ncbi:MAG: Fic family protein [Gammaproteobacteria bacterium]|nr:Fic family protein [Gammaproteobacteria bacterium]